MLVDLEGQFDVPPDATRRLAVLGGEDPVGKLRLSRKDAERLARIRDGVGMAAGELGFRLGAEEARDVLLVGAASMGVPLMQSDLDAVVRGAAQVFPVSAADLMPDLQGPELGKALESLKADWIASGFALGREALIVRAKG